METAICIRNSRPAFTHPGLRIRASRWRGGGQDVITLQFFYPVGVAGPLAQAIDGDVAEFNATHDHIQVEPVFTGGYAENMARATAAILSGQPPDVAILLGIDIYTLIQLEGIIPLDDYIASEDGLDIDDFFEAFMANNIADDQVWSIPWQRSTPILYYNKDAFAEVGLDPGYATGDLGRTCRIRQTACRPRWR